MNQYGWCSSCCSPHFASQSTHSHVQPSMVQVKLGRKQYWKKNRKWSLFPIVYTPPTPSSPSLLWCYTSLRILSVDLHCSGCRGQSSWHINAAFSNKPPHSPEPVLGTQWNTYFSSFLSFVFLLTAARQLVAAALNLSQGILAIFFFSSFSLFPDVTLAPMLNPPPTQPLSPLHPSLQPQTNPTVFTQGGMVPGIAPKQPHLTLSDNTALRWPPVKGWILGSFSAIW